MNASLDGLLTGLSLIVAIGAQNAYVLRQGLRRSFVGPVVAVCTVSDFVLIVAGVAGIGVIVQHAGWALQAVRWFGVAFLIWYGLSSAVRSAGRRPASSLSAARDDTGGGPVVVRRRGVRGEHPVVRGPRLRRPVRCRAARDSARLAGTRPAHRGDH